MSLSIQSPSLPTQRWLPWSVPPRFPAAFVVLSDIDSADDHQVRIAWGANGGFNTFESDGDLIIPIAGMPRNLFLFLHDASQLSFV